MDAYEGRKMQIEIAIDNARNALAYAEMALAKEGLHGQVEDLLAMAAIEVADAQRWVTI